MIIGHYNINNAKWSLYIISSKENICRLVLMEVYLSPADGAERAHQTNKVVKH